VRYHITLTDGSVLEVDNPSRWPIPPTSTPFANRSSRQDPYNEEYVGGIFKLVEEKPAAS